MNCLLVGINNDRTTMNDRFPMRTYAMKAQDNPMNDNDLSDDAAKRHFRELIKGLSYTTPSCIEIEMWQECRRRAEAIAEFIKDNEDFISNGLRDQIQKLKIEMEERERKAFEFAFIRANDWCDGLDGWKQSEINAAWYAYKEQQK